MRMIGTHHDRIHNVVEPTQREIFHHAPIVEWHKINQSMQKMTYSKLMASTNAQDNGKFGNSSANALDLPEPFMASKIPTN